ncbi:nitrogenase-stabilizing/protective protein NifW [Vulcanococcus limneticus Candia 3F8]|uniref:nitrogenase-stabilizing/protective protein NifW n=1 Tax=Vulcanococcus limneticus TaxID=2170428 RepID=UPI000B98A4FB|nr:nitrogenase-stabilizing/protective protein NifW [Vulcanococcus limneticus]MCP9792956.1 nitrogenase-stabilizing/protective protein NifW [Vulcanococcus limneticus MW73D5]MCP9894861.1 nitrogenase-stabilizing/protective protein NifW [Vulcanococcus limneticus Candia 3F8]MCP9898881.1 nitrogenase-stabilizing/protective protein NifW [Vulcanococcus limneticus Candia 3B3]
MTPAKQSLEGFSRLTDAEDYFEFFEIPYDPHVLSVNRLHILRDFSLQLQAIDSSIPSLDERYGSYRQALLKAYQLFVTSSPLEQKLFAVFKQHPGHIVTLSELTP